MEKEHKTLRIFLLAEKHVRHLDEKDLATLGKVLLKIKNNKTLSEADHNKIFAIVTQKMRTRVNATTDEIEKIKIITDIIAEVMNRIETQYKNPRKV